MEYAMEKINEKIEKWTRKTIFWKWREDNADKWNDWAGLGNECVTAEELID